MKLIGITGGVGSGKSELLRYIKEHYNCRILLSDDIPAAKLDRKEQDMEAYGCVILGLIGNLDHVTFVYKSEGVEKTKTITADLASAFLGEDIKNCGKNIRSLDALTKKIGLALYTIRDGEESESKEDAWLRIRNQSDTEIQEVDTAYYANGLLQSSGGGINADNTPHAIGDTIWLSYRSEDFGGSRSANDLLEIELSFKTPNGKTIRISDKIRVTDTRGKIYDFTLTGNEREGYRIEQ